MLILQLKGLIQHFGGSYMLELFLDFKRIYPSDQNVCYLAIVRVARYGWCAQILDLC